MMDGCAGVHGRCMAAQVITKVAQAAQAHDERS